MQPWIVAEVWTKHGLFAASRIAGLCLFFTCIWSLGYILLGLISVLLLTSVGYGNAENAGLPITFLAEDQDKHLFCRVGVAAVGLMWMVVTVFVVVHHKYKFVSGVFWTTYWTVTIVSLLGYFSWITAAVLTITSNEYNTALGSTEFRIYLFAAQAVLLFISAVIVLLGKRDLAGSPKT